MDDVERTVAFFEAIEAKDWLKIEGLLTDDFLYYGPMPDPVGKEEWMKFQYAVQYAFPDWAYHLSAVEMEGDHIRVTVHITGTHTRELTLPIEGVQPIPPTDKKIELPKEHALVKVKGGKISELRVESTYHGGLPGILEQLGIE